MSFGNSGSSANLSSLFTKEQLDALKQLLNNTLVQHSTHAATTSLHAKSGNLYAALSTWTKNSKQWIIDSGASDHMTGDETVFHDFKPCCSNLTVRIADGSSSKVAGSGSVQLSSGITLKSVLLVPNLDCNLISISKLTRDSHCLITFSSNECLFQELGSKKTIGSAEMCSGLYFFKTSEPGQSLVATSSPVVSQIQSQLKSSTNKDSEVMMWHYRLGHPNFQYLEKLFPHLFINKNPKFYSCEICQLAKHTRSVYPSLPYSPSKPFSLIHSDIWGPSRVKNINGARWFVTFVDDHTRLTWVFLMKEKSEIERIFQIFNSMVQTQFSTKIQVLKSDNAKEYFSSALREYLSKQGIVQVSSCVNTPQQNGIAERKNRHLLEVARSIMFSTNVPTYL